MKVGALASSPATSNMLSTALASDSHCMVFECDEARAVQCSECNIWTCCLHGSQSHASHQSQLLKPTEGNNIVAKETEVASGPTMQVPVNNNNNNNNNIPAASSNVSSEASSKSARKKSRTR